MPTKKHRIALLKKTDKLTQNQDILASSNIIFVQNGCLFFSKTKSFIINMIFDYVNFDCIDTVNGIECICPTY